MLNRTEAIHRRWQSAELGIRDSGCDVDRQCSYWLRWNKLITELRPDALLYRAETRLDLVIRLGLSQQQPFDNPKYNEKPNTEVWTWSDIPPRWRPGIQARAESYGYTC